MAYNFQIGKKTNKTARNMKYLDTNFPGCWVGHDGPIPWPPRSPDITPLDSFLWRYVKDIVYKTHVISFDELKLRIVAAIERKTPQTLDNTWKETGYSLDILRVMCKLFSILQY
jgi:hypothetical protein